MKPPSTAETKRVFRKAIHNRDFLKACAEFVEQNPELFKDQS